METNGGPIDASEASAALAAVRHSRAIVAWSGYPRWYWLAMGAVMAAMCYPVLLPGEWTLAVSAVFGAALIAVAYSVGRARGVCEGWMNKARTRREMFILSGPMAIVVIANGFVSKFVPWSSMVAAVLEFTLFAGAGLLLSARAVRR